MTTDDITASFGALAHLIWEKIKLIMGRENAKKTLGSDWQKESYQRLTNGRINAWLKLATKERKPSVLRPFE